MNSLPNIFWRSIFVIGFFIFSAASASAEFGEVVALTQPARVTSDGQTTRLVVGATVTTGDVVVTGSGGEVQFLFPDETRIVVGANSQLQIQELLFRKNNKARRLRVGAVAGTFRMLTGNSPRRAYKVTTPTATMAVRGTEFDFFIDRDRADTTLLVHDGTVKLCTRGGQCVDIPHGCQMAKIDRLRRFTQPKTRSERAVILRQLFPYAHSDAQLEPMFRALIERCSEGDGDVTAAAKPIVVRQIELPEPEDDDERKGNPAE